MPKIAKPRPSITSNEIDNKKPVFEYLDAHYFLSRMAYEILYIPKPWMANWTNSKIANNMSWAVY